MNKHIKTLCVIKMMILISILSACGVSQLKTSPVDKKVVVVKPNMDARLNDEDKLIPMYVDTLQHQKPNGEVDEYALLENGQLTLLKTTPKAVVPRSKVQKTSSNKNFNDRIGIMLGYASYTDGEDEGECFGARAPNYLSSKLLLGVNLCDIKTYDSGSASLQDDSFLSVDVGYLYSFNSNASAYGTVGFASYKENPDKDYGITWGLGVLYNLNRFILGMEYHSQAQLMVLVGSRF